ncbi:MAG: hypothetical protein ACKVU1_09550 [bacterium]
MKSPIKLLVHALSWAGEKIGLVVTPVILTVFYVTVIAVAGVAARIAGADMLHRKAPAKPTFWFDKPEEPRTKERYLAQF